MVSITTSKIAPRAESTVSDSSMAPTVKKSKVCKCERCDKAHPKTYTYCGGCGRTKDVIIVDQAKQKQETAKEETKTAPAGAPPKATTATVSTKTAGAAATKAAPPDSTVTNDPHANSPVVEQAMCPEMARLKNEGYQKTCLEAVGDDARIMQKCEFIIKLN